jgi:hypothetical protein
MIAIALAACLALAPSVVLGQAAPEAVVPEAVVPEAVVPEAAAASGLEAWSWPLDGEHREAARRLREARRAGPEQQVRLLEALVGRGVAALPAWFDILERQRVPETATDDAPQILSEAQRGLLLAAMGRLPAAIVRARVLQRLAAHGATPGDEARLAAIRVLAVVGEAGDLSSLARWAPRKPVHDPQSPAPLSREGRAALREAAGGILGRDARGWPGLESVLRQCDEHAASALLDGACTKRDPRAAETLMRLVRERPVHALQVASLAPRCGRSSRPGVDAAFALWALERAQAVEPEAAEAYLGAVGAFDDGDLAPALCAMAAEGEPRKARAAVAALRSMTGLGLERVDEWRTWLEVERRWREQTRPALARDVLHGDEAAVARALKAFGQRRILRGALVADVAPALAARQPALRALACSTLGALGGAEATESLLLACLDEHESVRVAARAALGEIHGEPPPESIDLLRAELGL